MKKSLMHSMVQDLGVSRGQWIGKSMGISHGIKNAHFPYMEGRRSMTFHIFSCLFCRVFSFGILPIPVFFQELSQIKALHAALVQRFAESRVRLLVLVDLQDSEQDLVTQELGRASCNADDGRDGKERVVVTRIIKMIYPAW